MTTFDTLGKKAIDVRSIWVIGNNSEDCIELAK